MKKNHKINLKSNLNPKLNSDSQDPQPQLLSYRQHRLRHIQFPDLNFWLSAPVPFLSLKSCSWPVMSPSVSVIFLFEWHFAIFIYFFLVLYSSRVFLSMVYCMVTWHLLVVLSPLDSFNKPAFASEVSRQSWFSNSNEEFSRNHIITAVKLLS